MTSIPSTRRRFISTMALGAGAAMAMPARSYARILGANDRITVAVMGVNDRGDQLSRLIARQSNVEILYLADVDSRATEKTAKNVAGSLSREGNAAAPAPRQLSDFRKALEDTDVDAMVIAAPDHWHGPATILGVSAGKHVYVEKPACHNPREGELMIAAARKYNRLVQMGNQRRSWLNIQDAMQELHNGVIGEVHYSRSTYARPRDGIGKGKATPVPAWLDYELWQGPAPRKEFRDNRIHYNWHWFWNWGTGEAGNNGVHTIDLSRWGLGVEFPSRVVLTGGHYYTDDDAETPDTQVITFEFPNGKYIMWEGQSANAYGMGGDGVGTSFHGSKGTLLITGDGYRVFDRQKHLLKDVNPQNGRVPKDSEGKDLGGDAVHLHNFFQSIRGEARLNSEIEEGWKSTLLPLLGNISYRVGRILDVDPRTGHPAGDDASKLWQREYAPGWAPVV